MDTKTSKSSECCGANDLVGQKAGVVLWCLPTVALVVGLSWTMLRPWPWIPALLVMGIGCLVNASRCGRLHCYITGPAFVLAAIYVTLATASIVPMRPNSLLLTLCAIAILGCLAEVPLGRYRKQGIKGGKSREMHDRPAPVSPTLAKSSEART